MYRFAIILMFAILGPLVWSQNQQSSRSEYSVIFDIRNQQEDFLPAQISFPGSEIAATDTGSGGYTEVMLPFGSISILINSTGYQSHSLNLLVEGDAVIEVRMELTPPPPPPPPPPQPTVLLVIDDEDALGLQYYRQSLKDLNILFDETVSSADLNKLQGYPTVIWYTGRAWVNTLNGQEQLDLSRFVEAGGHLILSGENLGSDIWDSFFYKQVLGAKYVMDKSWSRTVQGMGLSFDIKGKDSVSKAKSPDIVAPLINETEVLFKYGFKGSAGLNHPFGAGQATYLSFCFEAISGRGYRKNVLEGILSLSAPSQNKPGTKATRKSNQQRSSFKALFEIAL